LARLHKRSADRARLVRALHCDVAIAVNAHWASAVRLRVQAIGRAMMRAFMPLWKRGQTNPRYHHAVNSVEPVIAAAARELADCSAVVRISGDTWPQGRSWRRFSAWSSNRVMLGRFWKDKHTVMTGCDVERRNFLLGTVSTAATPLLASTVAPTSASAESGTPPGAPVDLLLRVNGSDHRMALDSRTTLLDTLRDHLGLTGTKKGCDHGQCGACTVLVDGRRVLACLTLAASMAGRETTTIEGLGGKDGGLHPMQQAFIDHDAFQCGYCTPGQIMSAIGCVHEGHAVDDAHIREYMSGNLCRCAAYPNIVAAIDAAKSAMKGS
jgi:xanthine dehydrogenase YagT iron-sulfur-binding subunit